MYWFLSYIKNYLTFLIRAYRCGSKVILIGSNEKNREISTSKNQNKQLDILTARTIRNTINRSHVNNKIHCNRFKQSSNDIAFSSKYKWVAYGDIKDAHLSSNIFCLIAWNFLFSPRLITSQLLPLLVLFCSPIKPTCKISKTKRFSLRQGLSSTESIFKLTQINIFKVLRLILSVLLKKSFKFQIYVDDFVFYADKRWHVDMLIFMYRALNKMLFINLHQPGSKKGIVINNTHENGKLIVERLGIIVFKNRQGTLKTSIRSKTINKYIKGLEKDIRSFPKQYRIDFIRTIYSRRIGLKKFRIQYGHPLFQTFPPNILWRDREQQQRVHSRVLRVLRKNIPQLRHLSHREIIRTVIFLN